MNHRLCGHYALFGIMTGRLKRSLQSLSLGRFTEAFALRHACKCFLFPVTG